MIRALVCDLGNVLLPFDFSGRGERFAGVHNTEAPETAADLMRGLEALHDQMSLSLGGATGEEFYKRAIETFCLELPYDDFCAIWSHRFAEDLAVRDVIARAAVETKVLLTNTDPIHWTWIQQRFSHMLTPFHHLLTSHEIGLMKPAAEVFRRVEEITRFPAEDHLLIDDLAANVEGARAVGWDGVLFHSADQLTLELSGRGLMR